MRPLPGRQVRDEPVGGEVVCGGWPKVAAYTIDWGRKMRGTWIVDRRGRQAPHAVGNRPRLLGGGQDCQCVRVPVRRGQYVHKCVVGSGRLVAQEAEQLAENNSKVGPNPGGAAGELALGAG
ncbi:hypothetical protein PI124_g10446 [Phytophthora idaei]|nr:hypothetical protein PI124_g10446 [Phytophthora idaei]